MKVILSVLFLAACSLAQSKKPAPTVARLVGTWKLVSIEDTMTDGKVQPSAQFGPHPQGFLMYEPDGHMCATLVNGDRPAWKDPAKPTDAEKITYYDTLVAYCGTFKLDSATSTVTHYPSIAWIPAYVGSTQPRPFRIEGNRLIITVTQGMSDEGIAKRVLVWERAR
jgi:lipocalin-like protein